MTSKPCFCGSPFAALRLLWAIAKCAFWRCFACACACAVPLVILSVAKNPRFNFVDTSLTLSMTSKPCFCGSPFATPFALLAYSLSFWAFCKKAKNPYFESAIRTLNLRLNLNQPTPQTAESGYFAIAQYDKQTLLLWLAFCRSALALSLAQNACALAVMRLNRHGFANKFLITMKL